MPQVPTPSGKVGLLLPRNCPKIPPDRRIDEIYDAALIHPIEGVSREGLWKIFDIGVIDGIIHGLGDAVTESGRLGRYLQAGFLRGYAAIILAGALIVIGIFTYFSLQLFPR